MKLASYNDSTVISVPDCSAAQLLIELLDQPHHVMKLFWIP